VLEDEHGRLIPDGAFEQFAQTISAGAGVNAVSK
jgi:hypothetical protein